MSVIAFGAMGTDRKTRSLITLRDLIIRLPAAGPGQRGEKRSEPGLFPVVCSRAIFIYYCNTTPSIMENGNYEQRLSGDNKARQI